MDKEEKIEIISLTWVKPEIFELKFLFTFNGNGNPIDGGNHSGSRGNFTTSSTS